jgi:hypothetical protein
MDRQNQHYSAEKQYTPAQLAEIKAHYERQLEIAAAFKNGRRISRR